MYYVDLIVPTDREVDYEDPDLGDRPGEPETVYVTMPQVPRAGELVEVKDWSHVVEQVTWRVLPDRHPDGTLKDREYRRSWRPVVTLTRKDHL